MKLLRSRIKRQRIAESFGNDFIVYLVNDTPKYIAKAYVSLDVDDQEEVFHNEMDLILSNKTWELAKQTYGCKHVGCKSVFKKKLILDGTIEKYKAILVVMVYTQKAGKDYYDSYSPVARLTSIRILLSLIASYGLMVLQMEVKKTFLNGELEEKNYMDHPNGFVIKGEERKVCTFVIIFVCLEISI